MVDRTQLDGSPSWPFALWLTDGWCGWGLRKVPDLMSKVASPSCLVTGLGAETGEGSRTPSRQCPHTALGALPRQGVSVARSSACVGFLRGPSWRQQGIPGPHALLLLQRTNHERVTGLAEAGEKATGVRVPAGQSPSGPTCYVICGGAKCGRRKELRRLMTPGAVTCGIRAAAGLRPSRDRERETG